MLRDAVLAYGAVAIVYLPWVPSLLFQAKHTGAPWSEAPLPADALGGVVSLLGGPPSAMAFALGGRERPRRPARRPAPARAEGARGARAADDGRSSRSRSRG